MTVWRAKLARTRSAKPASLGVNSANSGIAAGLREIVAGPQDIAA
jgi:hypothetical protein